ncbi:MAG TPA: hypothetical protein VM598_11755, partial [Bdellovibrionota bacterium]|nr:hypothetical protein [Bdellovibrionota bacterium]
DAALIKAFGDKDLKSSKIPLRIALRLREKDQSIAVSEGLARDALRAAVAGAGLFEPGTWDGQAADAAARALPQLVVEARATGKGSVIVIDPSGDASIANAPELRDADLVLKPEIGSIGPRDFNKRTEAAFKGKTEVNKHITELRHLVGLPEQRGGAQ